MSATTSRLQLLAAAALFSTGGAAVKATAMTAWQVAGFRSGIAFVAVLLLVPASRRGWSWRTTLVALVYATTMVLFVTANKLTTSANAIFLQSAAPLYILLASPWLLRERITRADIGVMAAVAGGLALVMFGTAPEAVTAPNPALGNVLATVSGLCWAGTVMGLRWLNAGPDSDTAPMVTVATGNLIVFVLCAPMAFGVVPGVEIAAITPVDVGLIVYLGVFQIGLAYLCLARGLSGVPAFEASLILLAEPALNPLWSWLAHGEQLGWGAVLGGGLILAATAARAWMGGRAPRATLGERIAADA